MYLKYNLYNNDLESIPSIKKISTTFQFNKDGLNTGSCGYFFFNRPDEIDNGDKIISILLETDQINDSHGLILWINNKSNKVIYGNYYVPKNMTILLHIKATFYYYE